jgi:uncharacterized membrane protein
MGILKRYMEVIVIVKAFNGKRSDKKFETINEKLTKVLGSLNFLLVYLCLLMNIISNGGYVQLQYCV